MSSMSYVTKIIKNYGETCFSTKPLPACTLGYYAKNIVENPKPFYCTDDQSLIQRYTKLVGRNVNPDFSRKTKIQRLVVPIPDECVSDDRA
jgi:hypothetical protein